MLRSRWLVVFAVGFIALARSACAQSEDLALLKGQVFELYQSAKYADAEPLAEQYADAIRTKFGEDHEEFAGAIEWLGRIYLAQARYGDAEQAYKYALEIAEAVRGPNAAEIDSKLSGLASAYELQGRLTEAEALFRRALENNEKAPNVDGLSVASSQHNLAGLYRSQGRLAEAEPLYRRALEFERNALPLDDPRLATVMANFGSLCQELGRFGEAEPLLLQALDVRRRKLPEGHPRTAKTINDLGSLYAKLGRLNEAESLFKEALDTRRKILPADHPDVAKSLRGLADLYRVQGRLVDAEKLFMQALSNEKAGPVENAVTTRNVGALYIDEGRLTGAEEVLLFALFRFLQVLPAEHPYVADAISNLADLRRDQGRLLESERLVERALEIRRKALPAEHPDIANSLHDQAGLYREQGRLSESEHLFGQTLEIRRKVLPANHTDIAKSLDGLASVYQVQGRLNEAELLSKQALEMSEKALPSDHLDIATHARRLASIYQIEGRLDDAQALYERSLAIRERSLPEDHPDLGHILGDLAGLLLTTGKWENALTYAQRATAVWAARQEREREEQGILQSTVVPSQDSTDIRRHISALSRTGPTTAEFVNGSFELAQSALRTQASSALAQMAARRAMGEGNVDQDVRHAQDLKRQYDESIKGLEASLGGHSGQFDVAAALVAFKNFYKIRGDLQKVDSRVWQSRFRKYTEELVYPKPLSVDDVKALLREDEALVLVLDVAAPDEAFIWVVSKADSRWVRSDIGMRSLTRDVAALRCGLDVSAWDDNGAKRCAELIGLEVVKGVPKSLPFDTARAHELYSALFSQVQDVIKGKQLLIVPSGVFATLPFQVLVTAPPSSSDLKSVRWLVRDHAVTVLPSVSSLKALRVAGGARARTADRSMIGIGNPTLDGEPQNEADRLRVAAAGYRQDCALPPSPEEQLLAVASQFHAESLTKLGATASAAAVRKLEPVPGTAKLLCDLSADPAFPGNRVLLGRLATKRTVKDLSASGELAHYRVVHFATHGLLPRPTANGLEPGLVLTPTGEESEDDNGYLSASDVAALKLDADVAILSACNTAAGGADGEALSGLARAFIYAQARALIVSHWEVYEQAAVDLISETLKRAAKPGTGIAVAHQRAILKVIDDGTAQMAHPAYWAPFVVVGEGASS